MRRTRSRRRALRTVAAASERRADAELRVEVHPPWPFRLRGGSADGLIRRRGASLQRLLHHDGAPVHVARHPARAGPRDLRRPRGRRDRRDVGDPADALRDRGRRRPAPVPRRVPRRPLHRPARARRARTCACAARRCRGRRCRAVTEQLIEFERAVEIQRRMIARARRALPATPACATRRRRPRSPATAPARLASFDLAPARALTLRRAAAEVASRPRRPARRRPDAGLAAAARDPGHRRRGRSRCSPSTARAASTTSRPATSATSSSSAASRPATRGRAPTIPEVRGFFEPLRRVEGPGRRVPARCAARAGWLPRAGSVLLERVPRVEPLARQELVGQRLLGRLRRLRSGRSRASSRRRPATPRGPGSRTAARRPRGRTPAASP